MMVQRAQSWAEQVAEVFQLVVEHCPSTRDPRIVCTLLQLSTGCRKHLQQTRGQCRVQLEAVHLQKSSKFLTWLKSHSGLVRELVLLQHNPPEGGCDCNDCTQLRAPCLPDVMSYMLATGFTLCSMQAALQVPGPAVLGAGPAAGPLPLRLHRVAIRNPERYPAFHDDSFVTVPLLGALGAAGVERLEVDVTIGAAEKAIAASISTLTTLQELVLTLTPTSPQYKNRPSTGRLCTALHPLSKLTRLEALVNPGAACNLPPSLRELELLARPPVRDYYRRYSDEDLPAPDLQPDQIGVADLSHLTALTHLTLRNTGPDTDGTSPLQVSLPADLKQLRVFGYASISGLQRLGRAKLHAFVPCDLDILHQLAPLQHPWALELRVCFRQCSRRPDPYWRRRSRSPMSDSDEDDAPYEAGREAVQEAHGVAASALGFSSHLSSLLIEDCAGRPSSPWSKIPWCEALAGLQHLQEVCIAGAIPEPQALRHLKALPALRSLTLRDDCPPDSMAVDILSKLTGLEELCMVCGRMSSVAVLAGVSALTGLSRLELYGWDHKVRMWDDELPLLLALQRLRVLHLRPLRHCSNAGLDSLGQQLPLLRELVLD